MGLSTFLIFLAAYLSVRTFEKVFAIWFTIKTDRDLKRLDREHAKRQQDALDSLNKTLKGLNKNSAPDDWAVN